MAGSKKREFCAPHAKGGMVDVYNKRCGYPGCTKGPSYGVAGSKKREFCAQHATDGMVNVCSRRVLVLAECLSRWAGMSGLIRILLNFRPPPPPPPPRCAERPVRVGDGSPP